MSTRTHLSIGEVLSLLTDDFPDLTITKIRFLESQGLISPERTASGYRKFYDFDIERLRWILRQQRENFLPLKVIRDRLEGSGVGVESTPHTSDMPEQTELDLARDPGKSDPPPIWMADHAAAQERPDEASDGAEATQPAPPHRAEPVTDPPKPAAQPRVDGDTRTPAHTSQASAKDPSRQGDVVATTAPPPKVSKPKHQAKAQAPVPHTDPAKPSTASSASTPTPPTSPTASVSGAPADFTDVSMTRAELLQASKLSDSQLTQLESFGIVLSVDDGAEPIYGADALVCARQAGVFLGLGMEPRHLRAFKVAADREAGLYEQLFLPLLRQRNPQARAQAVNIVDQLTAAGAAIHAALLQQSLQGQLRPRRPGH